VAKTGSHASCHGSLLKLLPGYRVIEFHRSEAASFFVPTLVLVKSIFSPPIQEYARLTTSTLSPQAKEGRTTSCQ